MKSILKNILLSSDKFAREQYLKYFEDNNRLISFMFHGNVLEKKDADNDLVLPQEIVLVDQFREFIDYYLSRGFNFVSPDEILSGTEVTKPLLVTFDDGYYNNIYALDVLKEFNIPAVFAVTARNVKLGKSFWWDSVYRGLMKKNVSLAAIRKEIEYLKHTHSVDQIEKYIHKNFDDDLEPVSDIDRPFSPKELKEFTEEPCVILGNHTESHAILTNHSDQEIFQEISSGQASLEEMTGIRPNIIAYPNGSVSKRVVKIALECGLRLGLTVIPKKNKQISKMNQNDMMGINRFMLNSSDNFKEQQNLFRSDIQLEGLILGLIFKFKYR